MKQKVAILFGGKSTEHDISLRSATNIFNAVDRTLFEPILLGVDRNGRWCYDADYSLSTPVDLTQNDYFGDAVAVYLSDRTEGQTLVSTQNNREVLAAFELAFPIIHGAFGEDGTLQGILQALNIPFVGPDVLGSAASMDKDVTKRLFRDAGLPIAAFFTLHKHHPDQFSYAEIIEKLGLPLFVKPANAGSSVGVSKATDEKSFEQALRKAFEYDNKILVEEAVIGKEVECAILGNRNNLKASVVGEIVPTKDFYSYEAKYLSTNGAKLKIPADIPDAIADTLRLQAIKAFETLCCEGMSRVDFFLRDDHSFVINEINTLPGFTTISMYPKLWENSGLSYTNLITELIRLGVERQQRNQALRREK